ncbi:MAG: exosortase/archaeosortase family protein [Terriglobia bacterium]
MKRRDLYFALFMLLTCAAFSAPLRALLKLSYDNDSYSHVVLIPLISGLLIYFERRSIFARVEYGLGTGTIAIIAGIGGFYAGREHLFSLGKTNHLTLMALSLVFVWIGGFVCCYGMRALKAAAFPALFLFLMIPLPDFLLNKIIFALQKGSTEATYAIFRLVGVPVLKQGFVFSLPGVNIQVARECSGIRSSLALLITGLLAAHYFLRSGWRKLALILMVIPIAVIKNAIRIATISLLSVYVDRGFLTGNLHHHGGILFAMIAIAMLVPALWWLQKSENHPRERLRETQPAAPEASAAG